MIATRNHPPVAAVTVTYGARWHLLRQVLDALRLHHAAIADIVVVDNGSSDDVAAHVEALGDPRIRVVTLARNTGSASGFRAGIAAAVEHGVGELIWLLDDDNVPRPRGLALLLDAYRKLGEDWRNAMLALRRDRTEFVLAARGLMQVRIADNSFLGFHLRHVVQKIERRYQRANALATDTPWERPLSDVGYAPYGGLLFHRRWVEAVGLPDASFFLYADDYEFTSRFAALGGRIVLCAPSEIVDLERSWHRTAPRTHHLFAADASPMRLYYSVRNRAYLESQRFVRSRLAYGCNVALYLTAIALHAAIVDRAPRATLTRLRMIIGALRDGWSGRLGRVEPAAFGVAESAVQ